MSAPMTALADLTAHDLMRTDVITLSPDDTIEDALAALADAGISGAPVIRADGKLVGALTMTDIAQPEHTDKDRLRTRPGEATRVVTTSVDFDEFEQEEELATKEDYSPELLGQTLVSEWMSDGAVCVAEDASLQTVCRTLYEGGVHRVFVTKNGKLRGIVSAMDVIRLLARQG